MKRLRQAIVVGVVALAATGAWAQGGRITGLVVDTDGNPLGDVAITLQGVDSGFEKTVESKKNGKFKFVLTSVAQDYVITLVKPGYVGQSEPITAKAGHGTEITFTLLTEDQAAERGQELAELESRGKAAKAYNAGAKAYNAGDLEGALALFQEASEEDGELLEARVALARIYLELERWAEARAEAEAYLEAKPGDALGLQMLYDALNGSGEGEAAEAVLAQLVETGGGAAVGARVFNDGVAAVKANDLERARSRFEQALALAPDLYQALMPLAQIYLATGELDKAVEYAEAYLEREPGHGRAHVVRYSAYQESGQTEQAEQAFAELKEKSPEAAVDVFFRDGVDRFNAGELAAATSAFEAVLEVDPDFAKAHYQLGLCYASGSDTEKAKASLERFLELAPDDPDAAAAREMLTYFK